MRVDLGGDPQRDPARAARDLDRAAERGRAGQPETGAGRRRRRGDCGGLLLALNRAAIGSVSTFGTSAFYLTFLMVAARFDGDPLACAPDELPDLGVACTIVGGRIVHEVT
ncbi:hypothetical protein ACWEV3_06810 [Saccharopolyspora sp. NPDC003752]